MLLSMLKLKGFPLKHHPTDSLRRYIPAKITILVVAALAGVAALALRMLLGVWNNKRDQSDDGQGLSANELIFLDLTDSENKHFRYTY
jgi:hypothetical protein